MAQCRGCSAPIQFVETKAGKLMPVDEDGTSHFARCPEAKRFKRRPDYPDDRCLACDSLNVVREPGKGFHFAALRCGDCGSHRWLRRPA